MWDSLGRDSGDTLIRKNLAAIGKDVAAVPCEQSDRFGSGDCTRRELLAHAAAAWAIAWLPENCSSQDALTRLILLGTGGGPRTRKG